LETNLDWNRPYVWADYLVRQWKTWKHAATFFSSIDMESSSDYMTGGTLTSTVNCWSSWLFKKDVDPSGMEQWSYQTLVGKKNTKITLITGYQCVWNASAESSAWTQQKIFMRDWQSKTSPDPRKQFVTELIQFINAKQASDHEIILNLDANEVLGEESQGIAKIMRECNMVDLLDKQELEHEHQLKERYIPTWYKSTYRFHARNAKNTNKCSLMWSIGI
jgi:hypothetical protein